MRAALDARAEITVAFFCGRDSQLATLAEETAAAGAAVYEVSELTLATLAQTRAPQGIVAVARFLHHQREALENFVPASDPALVLTLHDLADPGNAGTLIRCAEAFAADAICFGPDAVEPYNDKVVRATAGAIFRVPVIRYDDWGGLVSSLRNLNIAVVAADPEGADVRSATIPARCALLIGHERRGLRSIPIEDISLRLSIPQAPRAESLNAAVAGAILLYELARASRRL